MAGMKHLKKLKQFIGIGNYRMKPSLPQSVIEDIKDICLELSDNGFKVFTDDLGFNNLGNRDGFYPNLTIFKCVDTQEWETSEQISFEYSEISEVRASLLK
jgi:hypothetical protein